jgi:anhydro-N-acetylmuramic acid kinase
VVCGGGRHNPTMMQMLSENLGGSSTIKPIDALGIDGDALEAQAFAYLAVRSLRGLPLSFPNTTGVSRAATGGVFYPA